VDDLITLKSDADSQPYLAGNQHNPVKFRTNMSIGSGHLLIQSENNHGAASVSGPAKMRR